MAEEVRFFLRTALYTIVITAIYWFLSYERAGTALFAFLAGGALTFAGVFLVTVRATREPPEPPKGVMGRAKTLVGFADRRDDAARPALEVEDEPFPSASIWPLIVGLGATLVAVGLIYGPWFWIPGLALLASSAWGWATQLHV